MVTEGIYPLIALAVALGLKHGMDADHLATIDGLTRFNTSEGRRRLARSCGFLFSLGHGIVVCIVAVAAELLFHPASAPSWIGDFGTLVSAFFLLLLGVINLYAAVTEKNAAWERVSNDNANKAPTSAISTGWLAFLKFLSQRPLIPANLTISCDGVENTAYRLITPSNNRKNADTSVPKSPIQEGAEAG